MIVPTDDEGVADLPRMWNDLLRYNCAVPMPNSPATTELLVRSSRFRAVLVGLLPTLRLNALRLTCNEISSVGFHPLEKNRQIIIHRLEQRSADAMRVVKPGDHDRIFGKGLEWVILLHVTRATGHPMLFPFGGPRSHFTCDGE